MKIFTEKQESGQPEDWKQFLVDDDKWMYPYFDPAARSVRHARRLLRWPDVGK